MKKPSILSTNIIIPITALVVAGAIFGIIFIFTDLFRLDEETNIVSKSVMQIAGKTTTKCQSNKDCVGVCDTTKKLIPSCTIVPEEGSFCSCLQYADPTLTNTVKESCSPSS